MCITKAVMDTMTPTKGHGTLETVIAIILIIAYVVFIFFGTSMPPEYTGIIGIVMGYLFGRNDTKSNPVG